VRKNELILWLAIPAITLTWGSTSGAFERQWHAGVDLGLASVTWNDQMHGGLGGGLHLAYGLTDSYNALVEVGGSTHAPYADQPSLDVMHAATGMAYTLDVTRWVPYMGLLVGGYRFHGAELEDADYRLGFQGAVGVDYRPSRFWALGLQVRYHTFSDDPLSTHYVTTFGRVEMMWGW